MLASSYARGQFGAKRCGSACNTWGDAVRYGVGIETSVSQNLSVHKLGMGDRIALLPDQLVEVALGGKVVPIDALSGASLKCSRVNGEQCLEVLGFDPRALALWKAKGCFTEIIQYRTRLFMPVSQAHEIVAKLAA